ncbi:MAG: hypothetical protein DMG26_13390 [Acidobacteria bacterium]|nr:MAG: hypothetical protein DMG26_13390 [Acidobacteriota bacterium]
MHAAFLNTESRRMVFLTRDGDDTRNQPVKVEPSVMDSYVTGIPEQIIHAVGVHLTHNQIAPK